MLSHPLVRPADDFIWGNFCNWPGGSLRSGDGSCAKNDLEYVSPGLFAYQCQWKVLHCEGRADAAFTCGGVREQIADSPRKETLNNVKIETFRGTMTMVANTVWCFICGLHSSTRTDSDCKKQTQPVSIYALCARLG